MMMRRRDVIAEAAMQRIGCGYIMGATGQTCTSALIASQARQYPTYADRIEQYGDKWLGLRVFDCAQLTRAAYAVGGISLPSGATSQYGAGVWRRKGLRGSLPEGAGLLLFRHSDNRMQHVLVTVGSGYAVDARGHSSGVVYSLIDDYAWTDWCEPNGLDDMIDEGDLLSSPTLQIGARGLAVGRMQLLLAKAGYSVGDTGADGIFGRTTLQSIRALQAARGLAVDGIVGKKTWAALASAQTQPTPDDEPDADRRATLRKGTSGEAVVELQTILIRLGYKLEHYGADGKLGAETQEAVRGFQEAAGLTVDGIVGVRTWAALEAAVAALESSGEPQDPDATLYNVLLVGVTDAVAQAIKRLYPQAVIEARGEA